MEDNPWDLASNGGSPLRVLLDKPRKQCQLYLNRWIYSILHVDFHYIEFMFIVFVLDRDFLAEVIYLLNYALVHQIYYNILKSLFYMI